MKNEISHTKFFGLGSASIDFRIQTAEMGFDYTEKLLAQKVEPMPGGSVSNCLSQISRLEGKSSWLGKLGKDWIGLKIIEQLEADKIDTSGVIFDEGACSPFNLAVYAGEERRRVGGWLLPNSLSDISRRDIDYWSSLLSENDWLLVEIGEIPLWTLCKICELFSKHGVRIAVDVDLDPIVQCGGDRKSIEAIFTLADLIIPNLKAMKSIYGSLSAKDLAELIQGEYNVTTVVTAGGQGAWACDGAATLHQPALPVKVIDSVGAGDAFHGGLIWALAQNKTLPEALELAGECGAKACTIKGAR